MTDTVQSPAPATGSGAECPPAAGMTPAAPAFLPYGRQTVSDDDIAAVVAVLRGDYLTTGPGVAAFEAAFAAAVGAGHAVACSSGTAALHLAAVAARLQPGDIAIVPAVTFLATATAMMQCGADIRFADVDPDTALLRPRDLRAVLDGLAPADRARVRAVVPVHMAGQPVDMAGLRAAASDIDALFIEDACHALGSHSGSEPVGACRHGAMATFSLHPVKTVTAGEGGVVTTNNDDLAARLARARNHGMERSPQAFRDHDAAFDADGAPNPWYYELVEPGFNYRLTDIQAALVASQLRRLDAIVAARQALIDRYRATIGRLGPHVRLAPPVPTRRTGWHLCTALIDFDSLGTTRGAVMRGLQAQGIGTQVHYIPVARQRFFRQRIGTPPLPGADAWYARTLSLPLFPAMATADVDRVVDSLGRVLGLPA